MGADEARRHGLVNAVAEPSDLMDEARALARRICAAAPLAVRAVGAIVRATEAGSIQQGYAALRGGGVPPLSLGDSRGRRRTSRPTCEKTE